MAYLPAPILLPPRSALDSIGYGTAQIESLVPCRALHSSARRSQSGVRCTVPSVHRTRVVPSEEDIAEAKESGLEALL